MPAGGSVEHNLSYIAMHLVSALQSTMYKYLSAAEIQNMIFLRFVELRSWAFVLNSGPFRGINYQKPFKWNNK